MGYDSRIIIGEQEPFPESGDPTFVMTIATFDLYTMGHDSAYLDVVESGRKAASLIEPTGYYFYEEAISDDRILTDNYGDTVVRLDLADLIIALKQDYIDSEGYRRIPPALALLESFKDARDDWEDRLVVLHYGH